MAEKTAPKNRDEKEILGYRDVLNTIHESHEYIDITPNNILQLHRDLLKHAGFSYGGSFKNVQNYIKKEIRLLTGYDRDMQRAIVMEQKYTKEVTFAYLEMIGIKRGKRERGRYKALIDVLKTMGINLVIA